MNEAFIRKVVRCKMNAAGMVLELLPPIMYQEIVKAAKIVIESAGEGINEIKEHGIQKQRSSDKINNLPIQ